ncbi:TRAM domain-containing protein [Nocardioides sp.]|uniref:class I SAM-dependent RNA methyltransferase n=1 Tax=Nocardioides sp. TaxID=35761 RepID=UPI002633AB38|nr:TRAM domain-containing protein [Nocardioides sp.]
MSPKPEGRPDRRRHGGRGNGGRPVRARQPRGRSRVGERFEAVVGPVAHGGHCVARVADGESQRVVFVRRALPGERVVLEITEGTDGDRFWRGDAIEILSAAPDRVAAPCPAARPGGCGGCDFQHVTLAAQRGLKATVVREQLSRLAGLDVDVEVEAVPGDVEGLRWRTRQRYVDVPGAPHARGMRAFRSHDVIPVEECLIAAPGAREGGAGSEETVVETVAVGSEEHRFTVAADGFWQVHPGAPSTLVSTVLSMLDPQPGESVLDLFSGVGLFAAFLADHVGPTGRIVAIEGDRRASAYSAQNVPSAEVACGDVATVLGSDFTDEFDLVVLDPPREGARRAVVEAVLARSPRAVAYVACDPAALARDVALFADGGYELAQLRAFDLFPMTHHVECVALLTKTGSDLR